MSETERNTLLRLGKAISKCRYRVGIEELLRMSCAIWASRSGTFHRSSSLNLNWCFLACYILTFFSTPLVPVGGWLFEKWMTTYSSPNMRKAWCQNKQARIDGGVEVDLETDLVQREGGRFMAHQYLVLSGTSNTVSRQLNYIAFMMKFKGLSRTGQTIMSKMGMCSSLSTFDPWLKLRTAQAQDDSR